MENEIEDMAAFEDRFKKSYCKDFVFMIVLLALTTMACAYQFYIKHFGLSLFFAGLSFINSVLMMIYYSLYKSTKRLFLESEAVIAEVMKEIEESGKL
jgi:hypothetical protein